MLIHIEGVDLSGKSTLIDQMSRLFKNVLVLSTPKEYLPRRNSAKSRERIWKFYIQRCKEILKLLEDHPNTTIILDRFFFSEITYGKVKRGYDSSDMAEYQLEVCKLIDEIQKKYGYAMIYLYDDTESIRERFLAKGDDYIKDKKLFHNLKVSYNYGISAWEKIHKVLRINVFKENDYWNKIINEIFLSNYKYERK